MPCQAGDVDGARPLGIVVCLVPACHVQDMSWVTNSLPPPDRFPCSCSPKDGPCPQHCLPGLPDHSVFWCLAAL